MIYLPYSQARSLWLFRSTINTRRAFCRFSNSTLTQLHKVKSRSLILHWRKDGLSWMCLKTVFLCYCISKSKTGAALCFIFEEFGIFLGKHSKTGVGSAALLYLFLPNLFFFLAWHNAKNLVVSSICCNFGLFFFFKSLNW